MARLLEALLGQSFVVWVLAAQSPHSPRATRSLKTFGGTGLLFEVEVEEVVVVVPEEVEDLEEVFLFLREVTEVGNAAFDWRYSFCFALEDSRWRR